MKRKLSLIVLLLLSVVFTGCDMVSVVGANPSYRVGGIVTNDKGEPLPFVTIKINPGGETQTDEEGKWEFTKAKKGSVVTAELPGWRFTPQTRQVATNGQAINFSGVKPFTVTGVVQDKAGNPIEKAQVKFYDAESNVLLDTILVDGEFTKGDLAGEVVVEVSKTDYTFSPDKFTVAGKDTNLVFQGTKTSYTISGVIRDVYGNALSDVPVEITNGSALWKVHAFTDSSGHFSVSGLTGALLVKPNMPNLKFEPESETVDGIDSILYFTARERLYTVSGWTLDPNSQPIVDAYVTFEGDEIGKKTLRTDEDGWFSLGDLTGDVEVTVAKPGWTFTPSTELVMGTSNSLLFTGREDSYTVDGLTLDSAHNAIPNVAIIIATEDGSWHTTIFSDEEGYFKQSGLSGKLTFTPSKDGWEFRPDAETVDSISSSLRFVGYETHYTVSGRTVDLNNDPIANVAITFTDENGKKITTFSDAQGFYTQAGLSGIYTVSAAKENYSFEPANETVDGPNESLVFHGREIIYTVNGSTLDPDGQPIAGVKITFKTEDESWINDIFSDEKGNFELGNLTGKVIITASKANWKFEPEERTVDGVSTSIGFTGTQLLYTVSGQTVDKDSQPVAGVRVTFTIQTEDGPQNVTVISAEDGTFTRDGLSGSVTVKAEKDGWRFAPEEEVVYRANPSLVFTGEETTYAVEGWTLDGDGNPIPGVKITFRTEDKSWAKDIQSDDSGYFRLEGLSGRLVIFAEKPNWEFKPLSRTVDGASTSVEFRGTELYYTVTGQVLDEDENPVQNAVITALDGATVIARTVSDSAGLFTFPGLEGEVTIVARKDGFNFSPADGYTVTGKDELLFRAYKIVTPYTVSGVVTSNHDHQGMEGVLITFEKDGEVIGSLSTNENGFYLLTDLTGKVTVKAELDGWTFNPAEIVVDGDNEAVNFKGSEIKESYSVSGQIQYDDLAPVPGVVVSAEFDGVRLFTTTDAEGRYYFSGLLGTVTITPEKDEHAFNPVSQEVQGPADNVNFMTVRPTPHPYAVGGWVQDQDGAGLDDVLITFTQDGQVVATTYSLEGAFEKSGLLGEYYVSAQKEGWLFYPESIRVTGEDYELLFYGAKVVETYSAGGVVTDEDGAPVPGVVITAALEGGAPIGYATTNSSGAWSFSGLAGKVIFTPAKGDYGFNPGSQETEGPRDNVDFIAIAPAPVPYTVSGWVQEIDGAGLDDILITFSQDGQAVATTYSLEGAFEKSGLLGEYYVSAQKEGWLFYPESIRVTGEDNDLLFYGAPITETYRVSGRITDEDGMPVTAVVVIADFGDGVQIATTTNSNGEWYFDNLSASVTVIPRKDGYTFDPLNQVVETSRDNVDFAAKKDEPEPTRYRVEGQVLDHNGDAVTNVLIVFKQGGETVATTYAIEGFFEKTGLVGEYYISAQKDGWVFEPASIRVTGVDRGLVFYGVEISQSYSASGRITDENSIPVSAVLVTAELENGSTRSTTTDANGRWAFANLAGEVTITPSKTGYSFTPDYQIIDDETVNADFLAIPDTFGVSGRVEDEQGNPIPMASIRALVGSDQIAATASDSTGAFSLDGFEGTVVIQVQKDGFDFEQDSYTVSGPSILTFTGSRQVETYSITASAQSSLDDSGQAGVRIIFRRQRNGDVVAVETTDGDGMYTNPNTTGTYYVSAEKEGWLFSPEVIQVDSEHPTANFFGAPLAQTFDVSGIVLDTNGQRAPAVVIVAELVENRSISMHAMTNENGEWYFTGLAGEWEFIPLNDGRFDSFQPSSHLADSARNNLDFQAIPSPAGPGAAEPYMVEGYVLDEDGYGIVGAMVAALVDALEPLAMTWSGPGGYFSLDGLEGEVFVYVSKPGYDSFDPMAIAVSRPASLVFMGFQEDYDVSGSVTDVEGDPIPNVVITFTKDGKQVATAVTGPDGSFTYSGLKGEYEVTAQRAGWLFHPDPMTVTGSNSEVNFFGTPVLETYSASGRIHDTWGYGIEAVTVVLTLHDMGGVTLVTTTNGNGEWSFSGLRGKVTVEPQGPHSFNPAVQQIEGPMTNLNFTAF
ncbi:MAG: hypothetical protein AA931_03755 [Peptococcaceae bacterium 1109]|nr:MAG: hypothetical protein AA931_03755 [Peptococcaceae bacterium 1109]